MFNNGVNKIFKNTKNMFFECKKLGHLKANCQLMEKILSHENKKMEAT